ncbi:reverse transcriptase domain-containing protein [Tanacetum coccineum]|uniref:Reverse transcriptase domain-containing protein n=1 Tax=Tanacetum coccineum TaxID=301880 RepID=A0ABQ4X8W0_9ASTR
MEYWARYAHGSGGETSGPVDTVHGRIILRRWLRSWFDTYKNSARGEHTRHLHQPAEIRIRSATTNIEARFRFDATNNEVEYEALIAGLRIAEQMGVKNLQTNVDSHLVANQVNGSYIAKEPGMIQYLEKMKTLSSSFKKFSIKQVSISENKKADALGKIASTSFAHLTKQVLVEELNEKSINEAKVLAVVEEE